MIVDDRFFLSDKAPVTISCPTTPEVVRDLVTNKLLGSVLRLDIVPEIE